MSPRAAAAAPTVQTVTIPAGELKAAASWVARIVPLRPAVPILGGIVIGRDDEGHLTLSAFDYETYGSIVVDGADGTFVEPLLVHGRLLAEAAARMAGSVTLEVDDRTLTVRSGATKVAIRLMPYADYPSIPSVGAPVGRAGAADLTRIVDAVSVCAEHGATIDQLGLRNLHLTAGDGRVHLWATDRFRLAHGDIAWDGGNLDVVVSADAVGQAIKGMTGIVHVGADEHRLTLAGRDRTVVIILASTPEWAARAHTVWTERGGQFTVPRAELVNAIATAKIALDTAADPMLLTVTSEALQVARANDRVDADSELPVDTDVDAPLTMAFNATFLGEIVGALDAPSVRLDIDTRRARAHALPVEIRGVDADGDILPGLTFLLVPIRLNAVTR